MELIEVTALRLSHEACKSCYNKKAGQVGPSRTAQKRIVLEEKT